jgi:iron-sulfur cluster repair protein YtfE (RIC family)
MKRNRNLVLLSHDHYHGLTLANLIKKGAPFFTRLPNDIPGKLRFTLQAYENELEKHFLEEEEILFPAAEGKDAEVDSLIEEMLDEHSTMRELVSILRKKIDVEDNLDKLGHVLEKHIRKEERILFKKIEEILSEEQLDILGMKLSFVKKL